METKSKKYKIFYHWILLIFLINSISDLSGQSEKKLNTVSTAQIDSLFYASTTTTVKKTSKYILGAFSEINAKTIETNAVNQVEQAMNGTLSGLYSIQNGGNKFGLSNYNFYIRGKATTGDNSPLILVDGIDGNINLIEPGEIESITILKDAAELALYGLRGANGVILIETKKGQTNKNYMTIEGQFGIQSPQVKAGKLNAYEYTSLHNEANQNDGIPALYNPDLYVNNTDIYNYPSTDLPGSFIKDQSLFKKYNFTASGGNQIARYFALLGYTRQDGLFQMPAENQKMFNSYNERYNFRTNLDVNLGKGFQLQTNISAVFDDRRSPWISGYNVNSTNNYLWNNLYSTPANAFPLINPNGSLGGTAEYRENPIGLFSSGLRIENTRQLTANIVLNKDLSFITEGLGIRVQYGFENYNAYYKGSYNVFGVSRLNPDSTYTLYGVNDTKVTTTGGQMTDYNNDISFNSMLYYNKNIGYHFISAGLKYDEYISYGSGDVPPYKWLGTNSKIYYQFMDKYLFQFTGSYQGSNNYASGKRFGFFPAGAIGWVVSKEEFLKGNDFLPYMKARISYGKTANDKTGGSRFMHRQIFYNTGGYGFGNPNGSTQGSFEGTLGNPDARWEDAYKLNAGADLSMFSNQLNISIDYFKENRNSILVNQSNITPSLIGISLPQFNAGKIENTGAELQIQYSKTIGEFNISLGANVLYAKNTIKDLKEINYPENETYRYRYGNPVNSLFGFVSEGIYNDQASIDEDQVLSSYGTIQPGDIKYKDLNNDGIINDADKKVIGNLFPEFMYGFNGTIIYKNIDFSFQTEGSELFDVHLRPDQFSQFAYTNRWNVKTGTSTALYPRLSFSSDHNKQNSTYWIQQGSLFRLSAIETGYNLPRLWLKKLSLSGFRIFAKANNLFSTFESKEGRDFEATSAGFTQYPVLKSIIGGVSVKF